MGYVIAKYEYTARLCMGNTVWYVGAVLPTAVTSTPPAYVLDLPCTATVSMIVWHSVTRLHHGGSAMIHDSEVLIF
jgi:hypothetical protein